MTAHACYKVGAVTLILAQLAWTVSSLHHSAVPESESDAKVALTGKRTLAFGTNALALILSLASTRNQSLTVPAATVSLIATVTTWWYATALSSESVIARTGYGAALFSTAAALLMLASDMEETEGSESGLEVIVVAPVEIPDPHMQKLQLKNWEYVDSDADALYYYRR